MLKRQISLVLACLLLALVVVAMAVSAGAAAGQPQPGAVEDTPQPIFTFFQNIGEWRLTAGFIYLNDTCADFSDETSAYIRRRAVNGGILTLLELVSGMPECRTFRHVGVDESGIYYYNRNLGRIEAIYSDAPLDPPTPLANIGDWGRIGFGDGISALRPAGNYVYWIENVLGGEFSPDDVAIKRVPKSGGTPTTMLSYTSLAAKQVSFDGLGVTFSHIWWTDGDGLNRISTCIIDLCQPGTNPKVTEFPTISDVDGHIQISGSSVFWWNEDETPEQIRRTSCRFFSNDCSTSGVHTTGSGVTIIGLAANGGAAFWTENVSLAGNRLRRKALSGGTAETLAEDLYAAAPYLDVDGVIFQTDTRTIARLPFDADALARELGVNGWEVTQGIQRPVNDAPLVAGKTTYVRVYPTLEDGIDVGAAFAALHGSRNGEALPGSPIYPLNVAIPITAGLSLADRGVVDSGWLFRLPDSWTRTGDEPLPQANTTITLRVVVDPQGVYADTDNPGNNELSDDFTFTAKAPTCIIMRSVITHQSYQSVTGINVGQVVELAESIMPTPRLITLPKDDPLREIDWCWKGPVYGPFCSTPYELDDDDSGLLTKMGWHDFWADVPAICWSNNARSLYAGIVHKDADWDWSGLARRGKDQLLSKVPKYGDTINRTNGLAMTLVHEIGHNYGRRHIQCPLPTPDPNDDDGSPANPDLGYPYPTNMLDFNLALDDANLHFGFDPLLRTPVDPLITADYMTYCGPEWYSDYTWEALFNNTRNPIYVEPPHPFAPADGHLVRIAGVIDASEERGALDYAWAAPVETAGNRALQAYAAGGAARPYDPAQDHYHLQLIGANGQVLADEVVALTGVEDGEEQGPVPFEVVLEAPDATVARVQLMAGDAVLAVRAPGAGQPAVTVEQPAAGAAIGDELTVGWTAADPDGDRLLVTIHYSPNGGEEWVPLLVNYGGSGTTDETITLDLSSEAGSDASGALVRVLASDGYNTGIATSEPFTVTRRPPLAAIGSPAPGQTFAAGETVLLNGFAADPEDVLITGDHFDWSTGQSGQTADLEGLAPGPHTVQLTVTDSDGLEGTTDVSFSVAPLAVPETAGAFTLDGRCDDAGYEGAPQLSLSADGPQASARIIHTAARMWLCFSGLEDEGGYAGLLVDADNSGGPTVQSGDFGYFVQQDGTRFVRQGNGSSFEAASAGALSARIVDYGGVWSAELTVDDSAFGDWQRRVALAVGHFEQAGGGQSTWPASAAMTAPDSWAQTNLGLAAALTGVAPASAVLGTGDIDLTVSGSGFDGDNVVLWNGAAVTTTLVSSRTLTAVVPAALAAPAGVYEVAAGVEGAPALTTAATPFVVNNAQPTLTGLTPDTAVMGSGGMAVTVNGSGFVNGATAFWDGEARATTFVGPTELSIDVAAGDLAGARAVPVVVVNPEPRVGPSNGATFVISSGMPHLLLPFIAHE